VTSLSRHLDDTDIGAIAELFPALVRYARAELFDRHLDQQLAEDLVEDATVRWLANRIHTTRRGRLARGFGPPSSA
jgi:DNA-directed RNA polymerase specialized sigma24 family protein